MSSGKDSVKVSVAPQWQLKREREVMTFGIPFNKGFVRDLGELQLLHDGRPQRAGFECTGRWDDGSLRWVLVDTQPDMDCSKEEVLELVYSGQKVEGEEEGPTESIVIQQDGSKMVIDTGRLNIKLDKDKPGCIDNIALDSKSLFGQSPRLEVFVIDPAGGRFEALEPDELVVEETGEMRSVIKFSGKHIRPETGDSLFEYWVRLTVWAGKPFMKLRYCFINKEESGHTDIQEIALILRTQEQATRVTVNGRTPDNSKIAKIESKKEMNIRNGEVVFEEASLNTWSSWENDLGGVALSMRKWKQNFPKSIVCMPQGIYFGIYPQNGLDGEPIRIFQGMAKTHEILLYFYEPGMEESKIQLDMMYLQDPMVPRYPAEWIAETGTMGDLFPPKGEKYIRLELIIRDAMNNKPRGMGMIHFGDEPNYCYMAQGRAPGNVVWNNNEYDLAHLFFLHYMRNGKRSFWEVAEAAIQHWMDVDFVHHSSNPLHIGGICTHCADHQGGHFTTPSHEWVDGFWDYYHLTGNREALWCAYQVADNIMRHLDTDRMKTLGSYQVREMGWGMHALLKMYMETNDETYLKESERYLSLMYKWDEMFGGLFEVVGIYKGRSGLIATSLNALKRYYILTGDERAKGLFIKETYGVLDEMLRRDRFWGESNFVLLEAFAYAYRLTGDEKFVIYGMRLIEYVLTNLNLRIYIWSDAQEMQQLGRGIYRSPLMVTYNGQFLGLMLRTLLPFLEVADELDMLKELNFKF